VGKGRAGPRPTPTPQALSWDTIAKALVLVAAAVGVLLCTGWLWHSAGTSRLVFGFVDTRTTSITSGAGLLIWAARRALAKASTDRH
jgi:hypothetical protein